MALFPLPNDGSSFIECTVYILYGALTALLFIIGTDILGRYLKADKQQRGDAAHMTFLVMGSALIGYGCYMTTQIVGKLIITPEQTQPPDILTALLIPVVVIILSAFALTAEQFVFPRKSRIIKLG